VGVGSESGSGSGLPVKSERQMCRFHGKVVWAMVESRFSRGK